MKCHRLLSVLLIFSLLRGAQAAPGDCQAQFKRMLSYTQKPRHPKNARMITQVSGIPIFSGTEFGDEVALEHVIGKKDALVVGMTANHVYLFADGARLHGKMSFSGEGPRLIKPNTNMVKDGIIFHFPDAKPEDVQRLRNRLRAKARRKARTLSCATATYRELNAVTGWTLPGCGVQLPATIVRQIIHEGFRDRDGKPVRVEIYRTDDLEFWEVQDNFKAIQKEGVRFVAVIGGLSGLALALVGNAYYENRVLPARRETISKPPRVYLDDMPKKPIRPPLETERPLSP